MNLFIVIQGNQGFVKVFLAYISGQNHFLYCDACFFGPFNSALLIRNIIRSLTHTQDSESRIYTL